MRVNALLSSRFSGPICKYSYGMYLFHPFIILGMRAIGVPFGFPGPLVSIAPTYAAASLLWIAFEKQFLRLKRIFEYSWHPAVQR